ncbi:hypothetical protein AB1Y20_023289 [Prymnesium parvum]|uniref:Uncharacterized protein n=1 Tax=Prymnesium parvum TaxID=97485 RepID=A0AB34JEX6_PRYPA
MAAKRPWWHEIVVGLSTERTPAPPPTQVRQLIGPDPPSRPYDPDPFGGPSRPSRSPGGVIRRRISEWDPGPAAVEWVRRATFDGRAIAIRRAQDAHNRRAPQTLGISPILSDSSAPRARSDGAHLVLAPPFHSTAAIMGPELPLARAPPRAPTNPSPPVPSGGAAPPPSLALSNRTACAPLLPRVPASASTRAAPLPGAAAPLHTPSHSATSVLLPSPPQRPSACGPSPNDVTICPVQHVPTIPSLSTSSGVHAPTSRRVGVSTAPAVACSLPPDGTPSPLPALRGKGAKHARLCAGPWVSALASLPPLPLMGAKRIHAGLADVPLRSSDIAAVRRERAACALASILPWSAAGFVLGDSPEMVESRPVPETTARLVRALAAYGGATLVKMRRELHAQMLRPHPYTGLSLRRAPPYACMLAKASLDLSPPTLRPCTGPLREDKSVGGKSPVCRPYRCRPPAASRSKESLSIGAIVSLEHLATYHPSEWVRGHARAQGAALKAGLVLG